MKSLSALLYINGGVPLTAHALIFATITMELSGTVAWLSYLTISR
nr:MAG TPA: hypothetical protein [Caudoviricetes sp.]